jgi:hypothetical protein
LLTALAAIASLVSAPRVLAQTTRVISQTSLAVTCSEPGCDCIDASGAPALCPAAHVRNYDSGNVATPTSDLHTAVISGTFVGYDSTTESSMDSHADAAFGVLKGTALTHSEAHGTYVDGGGLASSGTASLYIELEFTDDLVVTAAVPGGPVSVSITQSISSTASASLGGGGLSIDPCLANGNATTHVDATLLAYVVAGGNQGNVGYGRSTSECGAPQVTGTPIGSVTINATDGDTVRVSHVIGLITYSSMGGGIAAPNRALSSNAFLDASNTALVFVEVLTPGASYTSASGTVYPVPEAEFADAAACFALLLALWLRRPG